MLFKQHKAEIDDEYNSHKGTQMEREYKDIAVEKCGFFLPECAYFDYINDAPDDARKAVLVKEAMEAIERENDFNANTEDHSDNLDKNTEEFF